MWNFIAYTTLAACLACATACGSASPPSAASGAGTAESSTHALRDTFLASQGVWNAADLTAIAAGLADDVVQLQPEKVLIGKDPLMASWRTHLDANADVWTPKILNAQQLGGLGYVTSSFTETKTPKGGGVSSTMSGLGLAVFRQEANGAWKQVFESWYTPPIVALASLPGRGPLTPAAEAVRQLFLTYVKDWNAADMDAVAALLDPDVVQLPPDKSYVGKDVLMTEWRKFMADHHDVWRPTVLDVQVSGRMAYLMYSGHESVTPKTGGDTRTSTGSGWEVFRQNAAGEWKLVSEIWFEASK